MPINNATRIGGTDFHVDFDSSGNLTEIQFRGKTLALPPYYPLHEINGEIADVRSVRDVDVESADAPALAVELGGVADGGTLSISGGDEIRLHWEPTRAGETGQPDETVSTRSEIGVILGFPLDAVFHVPEGYNLGRVIDRDMPVGETYWAGSSPLSDYVRRRMNPKLYKNGLGYGFFLVELDGVFLRLAVKDNTAKPDVQIGRYDDRFTASFRRPAGTDAYIGLFASMEDALADRQQWMETEFGIKKLADDPGVADWVRKVPLVITVDMLRSNGEIAHDYDDVTKMVGDLRRVGCPDHTLFYLPGWGGAYDSTNPTYEPHADLGGADAFRRMVDTIHANGYRVMVHANSWGLDPFHKDIDRLIRFAREDGVGGYEGWQCSVPTLKSGRRTLEFRTSRIAISGPGSARGCEVTSVSVPQECEAFMSIGGFAPGRARVRVTTGRRSVVSPPGWFAANTTYRFPFPLLLAPGENRLRLEVLSDEEIDWSGAWYQIRWCFIAPTPYSSWTFPIVEADTSDPEWIGIFVDNVAGTVREYGVDAVHVDATGYEGRRPILDALKDALPGVAISGEFYRSVRALGYWTFCQNARQSLTDYRSEAFGTQQQSSIPDRSERDRHFGWLNKRSPVADFAADYVRFYPHLCAADAFVPVGKVCNTVPARQSPRDPADLWEVLHDARRLNYLPGLRMNYRVYGLDPETEKAVRELAGG